MTERDQILSTLAVSRQWMSADRIAAATRGRVTDAALERLQFEYLIDRLGDSYKITDMGLRVVAERQNPADAHHPGFVRAALTMAWQGLAFAARWVWYTLRGKKDWI